MSTASERAIAEVFFALGDGTRLSVLNRLGSGGALSATALSEDAQISRQAVMKHLQVLTEAGLLSCEKRGREVLFEREARRLSEARVFREGIYAAWDRALERLRRGVEEPR